MNQSRSLQYGLPAIWQLAIMSCVTLGLCSCQSLTTSSSLMKSSRKTKSLQTTLASNPESKPSPANVMSPSGPAAEPTATTLSSGPPWTFQNEVLPDSVHSWPATTSGMSGPHCPHCAPGFAALPAAAFGASPYQADWARPEPQEYVCNGGDQNVQVQVKRDWSVQGLHPGDTVVHFDTVDGRTLIEPSNEVCLYAPRFAAVRKVYGVVAHEQHDRVAGVELPVGAEQSSDLGKPTTIAQPLQPGRKHSITGMQGFLDKTRGVGVDNAQRAALTEEQFLPFEDLAIIRRGVFDNTEKSRLAERLLAAVAWTHSQGLQVMIDNKTAVEAVGLSGTESVYTYELPPGKSRLRVVKIASKQNAKPGELVEFTLRFDNVGDQTIGNVTVIDRLHDRLEYLPESQKCSLPSEFHSQDEDGSPRVLRWEIKDPMKVGEGGLIRFTCRVR